MHDLITIDGAQGEGGGQILRSSLTLAALTGRPLRIHNIRAGRAKSGLLRQHLAAVQGAAAVCGAEVDGAELRSRALYFKPGPIRPGHHTFAIGSAGSASLVCQTVLPLLLGQGDSELVFEGGTHNKQAPPWDFLEHVYFPLLRRMGAQVDARLERAGFYPAGGGRMIVRLSGGRPGPVPPITRSVGGTLGDLQMSAWVSHNGLPENIVKRALAALRAGLDLPRDAARPRPLPSPGTGGAFCVRLQQGDAVELVTGFAERGRSTEEIAEEVITQATTWRDQTAPVGEHLADMLVLLAALYGGAFHTGTWSLHSATHVLVVRAFLGEEAVFVEESADGWRVRGR